MLHLTTGKVARFANVNVQTVRFYERKGLLPKPLRRLSGYREYPVETIGLVKVIKFLQRLGFSLREVKELLALRKVPSITFGQVCDRIQAKIKEIDARIRDLKLVRTGLAHMLKTHRQGGTRALAPVFDEHIAQLSREAMAQENTKFSGGNHERLSIGSSKSRKKTASSP
jgi:MerR family transcriptional regulator, copper efflux regulator